MFCPKAHYSSRPHMTPFIIVWPPVDCFHYLIKTKWQLQFQSCSQVTSQWGDISHAVFSQVQCLPGWFSVIIADKNKMKFIPYLYTCKHYFLTVVIFFSKNVALDLLRNICANFGVDVCSHSWKEVENVSDNQRSGWPSWISDPLKT